MLIISCDPGLTGAIALLNHNRELLECEDLPTSSTGNETGKLKRWVDASALDRLLMNWSAYHGFAYEYVVGVIERPIPMPSMPSTTNASTFDSFGLIRGLMTMRCNQMTFVPPAEWKKLYDFGMNKDAARNTCLRLFPTAPVGRAKDHNRAEAILIGNWYAKVKA